MEKSICQSIKQTRSVEIKSFQRSHRYPGCFKTLHCKTEHFRNSPVPCTVNEWNNLDSFGSNKTCRNSLCGSFDPFGVRLINRLRLGFSHLREHEFTQNFYDAVNPLCSCSLETENTEHFFLHCQNSLSARATLMNELNNISEVI